MKNPVSAIVNEPITTIYAREIDTLRTENEQLKQENSNLSETLIWEKGQTELALAEVERLKAENHILSADLEKRS
jgi:hypothetical protein